jgi:hypothetical protein
MKNWGEIMGVFGFLKKKKEEELPMPPPPTPPAIRPLLQGDIEPIRATEEPDIMPPAFEPPMPEALPALPPPEMPQMAPIPEIPTEFRPAEEKEVRVFDRTIPTEATAEEPEETVRPTPGPMFVAVEDYKRIINDTNTVRSKLMNAENFVRRLGDLKNEEERVFEKWRSKLEAVEKKLNYVDRLIEKAKS